MNLDKKKETIIISIALIIVAALVFFGLQERFNNQPPFESPQFQAPEVKEVKLTEETIQYKLTVSYPQFLNLGDLNREEAANTAIKSKIETAIGDFKRSVSEDTTDLPNAKSEMRIGYEVVYLNPSIASIKLSEDTYIEGAAHPLAIIWSFNYSFRDNREITLADIFNQGSDYLSALSELSRESLKNQLKENYAQESVELGTRPQQENFEIFLLSKDRLIVIFNVYQVADYALGPQSVEIPYEKLNRFMSPRSPTKLVDLL